MGGFGAGGVAQGPKPNCSFACAGTHYIYIKLLICADMRAKGCEHEARKECKFVLFEFTVQVL